MKNRISFLIAAAAVCCSLFGCGGGGGLVGGGGGDDDSFVGAAKVNVTVRPNSIDAGDRAQVKIQIKNVIDTGIVLKVRYPVSLSYANNTARIKLDSDDVSDAISPNVTGETTEWKYLVFFLPRSAFGDLPDIGDDTPSETAELSLELTGNSRLKDGSVEVDADVNDPGIPDDQEFNINQPQFESESDGSIEVTQSRN